LEAKASQVTTFLADAEKKLVEKSKAVEELEKKQLYQQPLCDTKMIEQLEDLKLECSVLQKELSQRRSHEAQLQEILGLGSPSSMDVIIDFVSELSTLPKEMKQGVPTESETVNSLRQELAQILEKSQKWQDQSQLAQGQLSAIKDERDRILAEVQEERERLQAERAKAESAREESFSLTSRISDLENQLKLRQTDLDRLAEEKTNLEKYLKDQSVQICELTKKLEDVGVNQLNREVNESMMFQELETNKKRVAELESTLAKTREALDFVDSEKSKLIDEMSEVIERLADDANKLAADRLLASSSVDQQLDVHQQVLVENVRAFLKNRINLSQVADVQKELYQFLVNEVQLLVQSLSYNVQLAKAYETDMKMVTDERDNLRQVTVAQSEYFQRLTSEFNEFKEFIQTSISCSPPNVKHLPAELGDGFTKRYQELKETQPRLSSSLEEVSYDSHENFAKIFCFIREHLKLYSDLVCSLEEKLEDATDSKKGNFDMILDFSNGIYNYLDRYIHLTDELQDALRKQDASMAKIEQLETLVSSLKEQAVQSASKENVLTAEIRHLQVQLHDNENEKKKFQASQAQLQQQCNELSIAKSELKSSIDMIQKHAESSEKDYVKRMGEMEENVLQLAQEKSRLESLVAEFCKSADEVEYLKKQIADFENKRQEQTRGLAQLEEAKKVSESRFAQAAEENQNLQTSLDGTRQELSESKKAYSESSKSLQDTKKELDHIIKEKNKLQRSIEEQHRQLDVAREHLKAEAVALEKSLMAQVMNAEQERDRLKQDLESLVESHQAHLKKTSNEQQMLDEDKKVLNDQINEFKKTISKLITQNANFSYYI
jgi:chromosome segregation ATPase